MAEDEEGTLDVCTDTLVRGGGRGGGASGGRGEEGGRGEVCVGGLTRVSLSFDVRLLEVLDDVKLSEDDSGVWAEVMLPLPFLRGSGGGTG